MTRPRILIIEEAGTRTGELAHQFEQVGYEATIARNGDEGVGQARILRPDLIVLDMTIANRLELCWRLCEGEVTREIPIFMPTTQDDSPVSAAGTLLAREDGQVIMLPTGGGRVTRLKALHNGRTPESKRAQVLEHRGLRIDLFRHQAYSHGTKLNLTPTEFRLLECLLSQPGRAFTRLQLMDCAMSKGNPVLQRTIDGHVKSLRRKLNSDREVIETVRGIGYRFRDTGD